MYKVLYSHDEAITSLKFSPNGKYLAASSADKTCRIWNIENNFELLHTIEGHS